MGSSNKLNRLGGTKDVMCLEGQGQIQNQYYAVSKSHGPNSPYPRDHGVSI